MLSVQPLHHHHRTAYLRVTIKLPGRVVGLGHAGGTKTVRNQSQVGMTVPFAHRCLASRGWPWTMRFKEPSI